MHISVLLLIFYFLSLVAGDLPHACIHDEYVLTHDSERLYTQSAQLYSDVSVTSTTTSTRIRILLDTSSLDSDEGYSCFKKGDKIDIDGDYYTCTSDDVLTNAKKSFLKNVLLPAANERLSAIFKVVPTNGPLYLFDSRCGMHIGCWRILPKTILGFQGGVAIPLDYTRNGAGVAADIVVFVTSRPIATAHVLAFGGQCQEDQ